MLPVKLKKVIETWYEPTASLARESAELENNNLADKAIFIENIRPLGGENISHHGKKITN